MSQDIRICEWCGTAWCETCEPDFCEHLHLCIECRRDAECIECARDRRDDDTHTADQEAGMGDE